MLCISHAHYSRAIKATNVEGGDAGLDEEPHLLEAELAEGVLLFQLCDQDDVLLYQGLHCGTQCLVYHAGAVFGGVFEEAGYYGVAGAEGQDLVHQTSYSWIQTVLEGQGY